MKLRNGFYHKDVKLVMNFKIILIIAVIIMGIIVGSVMVFSLIIEVEQQLTLENVQIQFVEVNVQNVELTNVSLEVLLDMYNPNDVTATINKAEYKIWFNDNHLGDGKILQRTDISPYTSRSVHANFDLGYFEAGETIIFALTEDEHVWRKGNSSL